VHRVGLRADDLDLAIVAMTQKESNAEGSATAVSTMRSNRLVRPGKFGIGAAWYEAESRAYGDDWPPVPERPARDRHDARRHHLVAPTQEEAQRRKSATS
jgi:hypothetical protein